MSQGPTLRCTFPVYRDWCFERHAPGGLSTFEPTSNRLPSMPCTSWTTVMTGISLPTTNLLRTLPSPLRIRRLPACAVFLARMPTPPARRAHTVCITTCEMCSSILKAASNRFPPDNAAVSPLHRQLHQPQLQTQHQLPTAMPRCYKTPSPATPQRQHKAPSPSAGAMATHWVTRPCMSHCTAPSSLPPA